MKKSRYFAELIKSYGAEIDDLVTDSGGKSVLQKRLNEKRGEFDAILPMIEFSPEMVAVVFYGAFEFKSPETLQQLVLSEPGQAGFLAWKALEKQLVVSEWARPLTAAALNATDGDAFLVTTAGLEFLRTRDSMPAWIPEAETKRDSNADGEEEDTDGDNDADDLNESGADWLSEQGFDTLDRQE